MQRESSRDGRRTVDARTVTTQNDAVTETEIGRQEAGDPDGATDAAERILDVLSTHLTAPTESTESRQTDDQPDATAGGERSETADRQSDRDEQSAAVEQFAAVTAELQALNEAIETLAETRQSTPLDRGEPTTEESAFEWVDTTGSEPTENETDRLAALETRLAAIEAALDEVPLAELEAAVDRQASAHANLEARLDSELDSIEAVFERLLAKIDDLEARLDTVDDTRETALEPLRQRAARRDALVELTQEALRHGVTEAVCHNCDQRIDLGVLETPYCPRCDRRFTGVSTGSWLPFSRAILRTAEPKGADVSLDRRSRQPGKPD